MCIGCPASTVGQAAHLESNKSDMDSAYSMQEQVAELEWGEAWMGCGEMSQDIEMETDTQKIR